MLQLRLFKSTIFSYIIIFLPKIVTLKNNVLKESFKKNFLSKLSILKLVVLTKSFSNYMILMCYLTILFTINMHLCFNC